MIWSLQSAEIVEWVCLSRHILGFSITKLCLLATGNLVDVQWGLNLVDLGCNRVPGHQLSVF